MGSMNKVIAMAEIGIYKRVTWEQFVKEFDYPSISDQFSYDGIKLLYDYLIDEAREQCEPYKLEVVELSEDWTEYHSIDDMCELLEYDTDDDIWAMTEDEVLDKLYDHSTVLTTTDNDGNKIWMTNYK